ncbi:MAG: hypothetical protein UU43_C0001G0005 [Candidatus Falkowbacteria bacterium GW2011_GWA2_41_14]|uniref:Uncharacterized protein n=1 Tax=Candidatus Falkowbacteria bacterium GW2011_GWA2_41_14 TaxID=1618635 RepID=A0A0G0X592_9BACT|nr:MAG: hypothetical protein UU43_C0001G0005 [Candidatus Falkowbacteria bacterium GW2011_GWA2_41_14]
MLLLLSLRATERSEAIPGSKGFTRDCPPERRPPERRPPERLCRAGSLASFVVPEYRASRDDRRILNFTLSFLILIFAF